MQTTHKDDNSPKKMLGPRVHYIERGLRADTVIAEQIARLLRLGVDGTAYVLHQTKKPDFPPPFVNLTYPFVPKWEKGKLFAFESVLRTAVRAQVQAGSTPQLFHAHFAYPDGISAVHLAREFGCPCVVTGRGDDLVLYPKRSTFLRKAVAEAVSKCDAFIGVSQHLCDLAIEMGQAPERCHHIPDGIPESFCIDLVTAPAEPPLILFVGELILRKNVLIMARAWLRVAKRCPEVHFRIIGSGPLESQLRDLFAASPYSERFQLISHIPHADVVHQMQQAAVLCLVSVVEGWPNVVMEAMACGRPVVASNRCGMPEQIVSDQYGYLCDAENAKDIANKLLAALAKTWNAQLIAERGRAFSGPKACEQIAALYQKVLA